MSRFSLVSRCVTCGKEITQSGPSRAWVHGDAFYSKADHPAEPGGRAPYLTPKKPAAPPPAPPAKESKRDEPGKELSAAQLRRRLQQGTSELKAPEMNAAQRRRLAAVDQGKDSGPSEAELAARRLRMLRHQEELERGDQP